MPAVKDNLLSNHCILVPPSGPGRNILGTLLRNHEARILAFPRIVASVPHDETPLKAVVDIIDTFHWIIVSGRPCAEFFLDYLKRRKGDYHFPAHLKTMAIGQRTVEVFRKFEHPVHLIPREHTAQELANSIGQVKSMNILLIRPSHSSCELPQLLERNGARVSEVTGFSIHIEVKKSDVRALEHDQPEAIAFSDPTALRFFVRSFQRLPLYLQHRLSTIMVFAAGPTTARVAYDHNFSPVLIADGTIAGLVDLILKSFQQK